ncbi:hypothetical protein MSG28_003891 [Choristoneura fumiferana]|uniref:Uncharacterized protein n=1 Tax=Choristoneura fumiferana TaxID=7141 RepID=A0ACC0KGY2_CHOFU|nr:hypothetical protein MSG28_003891 [Choristoneura fumiferana]
MCVHDTDTRGLCTKNGAHCAFAHGAPDLRPPVLDVRELQAMENPDAADGDAAAPNALDRERNLMNEDPKWQVHFQDKRRSPRKYKYRSTPCPNVKHGEEWGEPSNCEAGEACGYCHTRTEQQFHPEIYKSTKSEELSAARELSAPLECGTNLAELLSSALPEAAGEGAGLLGAALALERRAAPSPPPAATNGSGDSECASTSSGGSSGARAPGAPPDKPAPPPSVWAQAAMLQEVVGNALDDMNLDDPLSLVAALDRDLADGEPLLPPSAPVNIPRAHPSLRAFSPPAAGSPLPPFLRYAPDAERLFNSHSHSHSHATLKTGSYGGGGFEFAGGSPGPTPELSRLRDEVVASRAAAARWDERIAQARSACGAWQREADEAARAAALAERQRDEAVARAHALRRELDAARGAAAGARARDLRTLPLPALKQLQAAARADLEEIEKVLYLETATKCMDCEERPRAVTLAPCNHYVLCDTCARNADECPYCQTPVQRHQ